MLHVVLLWETIVATGLTTTLTVKAAPVHVPGGEVGVTLYTAVADPAVVLLRLSCNVVCPEPDPALPLMFAPVGLDHA